MISTVFGVFPREILECYDWLLGVFMVWVVARFFLGCSLWLLRFLGVSWVV